MSDFPLSPQTPPFIHTWMPSFSMETRAAVITMGVPVSSTWATANQARYYPVSLPWPYHVRRVFWVNGLAVGGNADFGIYTMDGARIYSTGSTVTAGASVPQYVDPTDFVLSAGDYYFAFNHSATTNAVFGNTAAAANQRLAGVLQQALGSVTLPSPTATFATASVAGMNLCGITWTPSGF